MLAEGSKVDDKHREQGTGICRELHDGYGPGIVKLDIDNGAI